MLKLKEGLEISKQEVEMLDEINCDNATGNHLLGRQRSDEYWHLRDEIYEASIATIKSERQKQLLEYLEQASDYFYWKKLPEDKKLFIETEDENT